MGSSPVRSRSNFFFLSHKKIKILIIYIRTIHDSHLWRIIEESHRVRPAPAGLVVNARLVALVALLIHAVPTATAALSKVVDEARPNLRQQINYIHSCFVVMTRLETNSEKRGTDLIHG